MLTLLTEPVDGINSENVVSYTNLCTSPAAMRSSVRTVNDRGPSGPVGHTAAKFFPGENELTDPNTLATV